MTPPKDKIKNWPTIRAWAVYVLEQQLDEAVASPVEWLLLTTVEVRNFQDAKKRVEWYSGRWGIEVYHRTLKSGCRIKDRQLGTADRLETCLGVDMVVAWRVYHLTMLGRETPEVPCTVFLRDIEWKALCCYVNKDPIPPEEPPTLSAAIYMIGGIGGHLGRKADGPPGTQTLWRGLQRLDTVGIRDVCYFYSTAVPSSTAVRSMTPPVSRVGNDHPLMGDPLFDPQIRCVR